MPDLGTLLLWLIGIAAFVAIILVFRRYFNTTARERRRRRRSYRRLVPKSKGAKVKLTVRLPGKKPKK